MGTATIERQTRAEKAFACVGPVGYLFGSPAAARVLSLLIEEPQTLFGLSDLQERIGARKYTLQQCLKLLQQAGLVCRRGQAYTFAVESPLARPIAEAIQISQRMAQPSRSESFAESVMRWATAPSGADTVDGPLVERPAAEAERIARLKRLPDTPADKRQTFEHTGAFAI